MEPESRFYAARRLRLHFVDWGNPDSPPLVLVHGGLDHCRSWDWVAEAFRKDFHVFAVDLAGHGDSDHAVGGSYALTDFVFDLSEFFDAVGISRASLIGHSMGGGVCSLFAGAFPERIDRLILIEGLRPAMASLDPVDERIRKYVEDTHNLSRRAPRSYASVEEAMRRMMHAHPALSGAQAAHLTAHGLKRDDDGSWRWKYDNFIRTRSPSRLSRTEVEALWRRIDSPVLLIGGGESGRPDPSKNGWLDLFRSANSVLVPNAGHWVHHEALDQFLDLAGAFLRARSTSLSPDLPAS
jgi:pimeloyl-ACP methyl ester carboxylesterase